MKDFMEQQLWLAPWYFFISATNGADEGMRYHVDDNKVYVEGILKVATKVGHPPAISYTYHLHHPIYTAHGQTF